MRKLFGIFLGVIYKVRYFGRLLLSGFAKKFMKQPIVKNTDETIEKLLSESVSMSRFGDGELMLAKGMGIRYQKPDAALQKRLCEILASDAENCIICVSDVFGDMPERDEENRKYWKRHIDEHRWMYYRLIDRNKVYYNTTATRVYKPLADKSLAAPRFEKWKKLWDGKDVIFIEGEKTRMGVGNDLFTNAKSIRRIIGPAENAFERYGDMLSFALTMPKDVLFILALGPAATVMSFDLSQHGYRALDLGHMDVEYEWFLRGNSDITLENKYVNEVDGGNIVNGCNDETYLSSIIRTFN